MKKQPKYDHYSQTEFRETGPATEQLEVVKSEIEIENYLRRLDRAVIRLWYYTVVTILLMLLYLLPHFFVHNIVMVSSAINIIMAVWNFIKKHDAPVMEDVGVVHGIIGRAEYRLKRVAVITGGLNVLFFTGAVLISTDTFRLFTRMYT